MGMRGGDTFAKTAAVQQFSCLEKAGGRVEPLRVYTQKESPGSIVRKIPLAYDNQRARQNKRWCCFRSKTFVKTISSRICAGSLSASGAQFVICLFTFRELQRASYSSSYRKPKCTQVDAGG